MFMVPYSPPYDRQSIVPNPAISPYLSRRLCAAFKPSLTEMVCFVHKSETNWQEKVKSPFRTTAAVVLCRGQQLAAMAAASDVTKSFKDSM